MRHWFDCEHFFSESIRQAALKAGLGQSQIQKILLRLGKAYWPVVLLFGTIYAYSIQHSYFAEFGIPLYVYATATDALLMSFGSIFGTLQFSLGFIPYFLLGAGAVRRLRRLLRVPQDRFTTIVLVNLLKVMSLIFIALSLLSLPELLRLVGVRSPDFLLTLVAGGVIGFLMGVAFQLAVRNELFSLRFVLGALIVMCALFPFGQAGHRADQVKEGFPAQFPDSILSGMAPCFYHQDESYCHIRDGCRAYVGALGGFVFIWDRVNEKTIVIPKSDIYDLEYRRFTTRSACPL